ncbi:hypothetical protein EDD15DRAFT_2366520 [Pisolithus albus]|nr:hypothetical protein EDD15DRAFT_2366520 [Pisolithus albus]
MSSDLDAVEFQLHAIPSRAYGDITTKIKQEVLITLASLVSPAGGFSAQVVAAIASIDPHMMGVKCGSFDTRSNFMTSPPPPHTLAIPLPPSYFTPPDIPTKPHQTSLFRETKRATAGQGGAIMQLERVGDILAQPQQTPRQWVILPDDAPRNFLAPTPHRQRRVTQASQKGQKRKTRTTENHTEDSAIEMNLDCRPSPEFQMAEPGSRFGFHTQTPRQPSFIGTQSLNEYEQDRTMYQAHQTANTAAPRAQGRAVVSQTTTTTQLVSQQPRIPQDRAATERNSGLTSRFRPQPLSAVPEVPSMSSTPNPFVSRCHAPKVFGDVSMDSEAE